MTTFNTKDYAIYLPAINSGYASFLTKPIDPKRPFPESIKVDDLTFWKRGNKLFHHPYILHSIGQYTAGSTIDNAITRMGKTDQILIGDSGGYQIGAGTLHISGLKSGMDGNEAVRVWEGAYEVKLWIIGWLNTYAKYSMTLDMPLWALAEKGKNSPFHNCTKEQLTALTVDNLQFIEIHQKFDTKWLNVVQGNDVNEIKYWWNEVKWFRHGGWALAGGAGRLGGLAQLLTTVLMMRDDGAFEIGNDWLHALGVSQPKWTIILTAIQQCLRKINPKIIVSYDSSSPFQEGGKFEQAAFTIPFTKDPNSWQIKKEESTAIQDYNFIDSNELFPHPSALGDILKMKHLNVITDMYNKKQYDSISNNLLVHHNIWTYLDAFQRANDIAFDMSKSAQVPDLYLAGLEIIKKAFEEKDWSSFIENNRYILDEIAENELI